MIEKETLLRHIFYLYTLGCECQKSIINFYNYIFYDSLPTGFPFSMYKNELEQMFPIKKFLLEIVEHSCKAA